MAYWCFIPRLNPFCKFLMCIFYTSNSTFIWKKVNVFKTIMMKRYTNFPLSRPMLQSYGNQSNGLCSKFIGWSQWRITGSKHGQVRFTSMRHFLLLIYFFSILNIYTVTWNQQSPGIYRYWYAWEKHNRQKKVKKAVTSYM